MQLTTPASHQISFGEQIYCFDICSTDFAYNLICISTNQKLTLGLLRFPEESQQNLFEWERMKEIHHESRCHALCFAPETSLVVVPKIITICTADADFRLRIFRTDLQNTESVQVLQGHTSYINDVAWDCGNEFLASVSDDHSCRIWSVDLNYENSTTFCLSSAGMSVKWHPEEPQKVLVAEKKGLIHLYNVQSQQAMISLETSKCPLMSADWSLYNRFYVTALVAGDIVTWDTQRPYAPPAAKQVHEDGGRVVRFSPSNSDLVTASVGRPDITLKVLTAKSNVPLIEAPLKLFGGMAWHHRLPYVAAASDRKLCFWKVLSK